jgi:acetyl-CoA carboxylase carboxyl transferase subunit beta
LRVDARQLLRLGIVDGVVPEPPEGNQTDHAQAAQRMRGALTTALRKLSGMDGKALVAQRRARFRSFGAATVTEHEPESEESR